jgi:hypothetical protein
LVCSALEARRFNISVTSCRGSRTRGGAVSHSREKIAFPPCSCPFSWGRIRWGPGQLGPEQLGLEQLVPDQLGPDQMGACNTAGGEEALLPLRENAHPCFMGVWNR